MKTWQLQDAKAKLSQLIHDAVNKGPQNITVRGKSTAILLSIEEYQKLTKHREKFTKFLRNSPLRGINLNIKRNKSTCRDIDL